MYMLDYSKLVIYAFSIVYVSKLTQRLKISYTHHTFLCKHIDI